MMNESAILRSCVRPVMRLKRDRARAGEHVNWDVVMTVLGLALFWAAMFWLLCAAFPAKAHAQVIAPPGPVDIERLADAIYAAEGGPKTRHPYGICKKYKTTTPRQACINTINHAIRDWDGNGDFIVFLGKRYCPVGAANDPRGLNKNWIKNVKYFYSTSGAVYYGNKGSGNYVRPCRASQGIDVLTF